MQKLTDNIYALVIMAMAGTFLLVALFCWLLWRNQWRLIREKERSRLAEIAHQKDLLQAVIESSEAERMRIGRDLHDGVGAALSGLRLMSDRMAIQVIDKLMRDVRNIAHNLSPEILTLNTTSEAISELCHSIDSMGDLDVTLVNEVPEMLDGFSHTQAMSLYRVLEELLNNTIRHAGAASVDIIMTMRSGCIQIDYSDDGRGLSAVTPNNYKGRGLHNIESRLGIIPATFVIGKGPAGGYHMQITIPVGSTG